MTGLCRYGTKIAAIALVAIAAVPVTSGDTIIFEWDPGTNDNWGQASNWIQNPGAGDIPDAPNHLVRFFGQASHGKDVDLQGHSREVHSIEVYDNDQYHFRDGTLGNWGRIRVETQVAKFGPSLIYQQLGFGVWSVAVEGGVRMDAVMEGSGTIIVRGGPEVEVQLNAANTYDGDYKVEIGTTTLGSSLALQNARVFLDADDPIDFNGLNPTFGGLAGVRALTLGSTVLTLDGHVRETSTYAGALTSDGNGQIICATADRFPQEFTGSISNLSVFRVDSGLASLGSGTFDFVSIFPSGAIDINGGELAIEDGAEVTLTSANANGGTVNISGGKLSIGDAELNAARITSVSNGEVALSNTDLSAPSLIIGTNGVQNISSTFAGKFTGSGSFKKVGTGALTLTGANTLTGEAIVDEGKIVLGTADTLQNTILRSNVEGGLNINGFDPHIGGLRGSTALDMGNAFYTLGSDGADASYSGSLSASSGNLNNPVLLKTGSNVQELTGNSSFRGNVWVDGGDLRIAGGGSFAPIGNHEVLPSSRLDAVDGSTLTPKPWLFVGGLVFVEGSTLDAENISLEGSTLAGLEALSGSTVTASEVYVGRESGDIGYVGVIGPGTSMSAGRLRLGHDGGNGIGFVGIDDSATVTVSDFVRLHSSISRLSVDDATLSTNKLIGVGSLGGTVALSDPAGESALTVGIHNGSSTFDGLVRDSFGGPGSITKTGTGSFTLTNANTYTGGTIVTGGTLVLGNSTGSATGTGGVAVANGGTLGGNGSASGTSTIASGGTVAPGTSIGAMTLQNATFQAGSTLEIEFDGLQHDELFVTGTATLAGTLEIVDLNGLPAAGNSFVVLTAGTLVGEFDEVAAPAGFLWIAEYDYDAGTVTLTNCDDDDGDGVCNDADACPGFDDNMDIDNDGVPDACDTDCSGFPVHVSTAQELIDAIHCANGQPDANTIYLDADITLTGADNDDANQGPNGLPSVISPIVIEGQDHIIERDTGAPFFRIFRVSKLPTLGTLTVHDTTLRNGLLDSSVNQAFQGGGAVLVTAAQLYMKNCLLMDNNGFRSGGAIMLRDSGVNATLESVVMTGNKALNGGEAGAIYVSHGQLTIRDSIIAGNRSIFNGSAVVVGPFSAQATITNTIISGNRANTATIDGFSVRNSSTLTLVNCTLAGNYGNTGGGLYTDAGAHSTLINSLIWGNDDSTESQVRNEGILDVSHTGIQGGLAGITGAGTINDNGGNLDFSDTDPVFVDPVAPASAPTTAGDYHLAPISAAVDQGDNTEAINAGLTTDFEGDDRIIHGQVDMGADEVSTCPGDGDDDGDGVCNAVDLCPGFDDAVDSDADNVPDGCDTCPGFDDTVDTDNDGVPDGCDMDCSGFPVHASTAQELIDAMHCANGQPDANTIYLDADITLTAADNTDQGSNGLPGVVSPIVIEGQGHTIRRDENATSQFRLFRVDNVGDLTINQATLRNGFVPAGLSSADRGGGAVLVSGGQVTITDSTIADNNGRGAGGGIYLLLASAKATLDGVTMTGNVAANGGDGGAINGHQGGLLTLRNSIIAGNKSSFGGAIGMERQHAETTITNTLITGNRPNGVITEGMLTMVNSTVAGNAGGGLVIGTSGAATVINSLVWGNAADTGPQVSLEGTLNVSYTGIEGGVAGIGGAGTVNDNGGNLTLSSNDPVFVDPIAPAGAPTTDGDYHLAPNSVAIDQGDNAEAIDAGLTTDFEGDDRILEGTVDMGADEESTCPGEGDDDGDGVCNSVDVCPGFDDNVDTDEDGAPDGCDACAGGAASGDANGDGEYDLEDYVSFSTCLTGPSGDLGIGCECFDFDGDGDNDLADFARLQRWFGVP